MTDEQIREWAEHTADKIGDAQRFGSVPTYHILQEEVLTLIASVRAEAAEEFCKLFDGHYYGPFEHPSTTIRRALVKERKG